MMSASGDKLVCICLGCSFLGAYVEANKKWKPSCFREEKQIMPANIVDRKI